MKLATSSKKGLIIIALGTGIALGACSPGKLWKKQSDPAAPSGASAGQTSNNKTDTPAPSAADAKTGGDQSSQEKGHSHSHGSPAELSKSIQGTIKNAYEAVLIAETLKEEPRDVGNDEKKDAERKELSEESKKQLDAFVRKATKAMIHAPDLKKDEKEVNPGMSTTDCYAKFISEYSVAYAAQHTNDHGIEVYSNTPREALNIGLHAIGLELGENGECEACDHDHDDDHKDDHKNDGGDKGGKGQEK